MIMKTHYHQVIAKQQAYLREGVHSDFGLAVPAGNSPREQTTGLKRKGGNFFPSLLRVQNLYL